MPRLGLLLVTPRVLCGLALLAICLLLYPSAVSAEAERLWSQERVAIDSDGKPIPPPLVRAEDLAGLIGYSFPISDDATLLIETNVDHAQERGIGELAASVSRAWSHVYRRLGIAPRGDVLLYLVEVDELPTTYRFEAEGDLGSRFGEVRLAWIPAGSPLWGVGMPDALAELVFDTIPHEFVHDQLDQVEQLEQELSGGPCPGTRWFIEGMCEMVAKEFCQAESPVTWARALRARRVERAGQLLASVDDLLGWSQEGVAPSRESDLYGASMVLVQLWAERTDPLEIVRGLLGSTQTIDGEDLIRLMQVQLGRNWDAINNLVQTQASGITLAVQEEEARASKRTGLPSR